MILAANLSLMFTELPIAQRFAAAAEAGFEAVEIQFPYTEPLAGLDAARKESGLPLALINLPPDDLAKGEVGVAAQPHRKGDFRLAVEEALIHAKALRLPKINVLTGRAHDTPRDVAMQALGENLRVAGDAFAEAGIQVMVEPVNPDDASGFFLIGLDMGLEAVARANHPNVRMLFDLYHMARTEPSLADAIVKAGPHIGHVQFADTPGRHEPGSGTVDFAEAVRCLKEVGYDDVVSAEYRPKGPTPESLGWMASFKEHMT